MNIGEIEERTGMSRANIRYYETEGLLSPERLENGYRNYSAEDLAVLQRIRLLRALGISVEDIRALQTGKLSLYAAAGQRLEKLAAEQNALGQARTVCQALRDEGVSYASLNPQPWLERLAGKSEVPAAQTDVVPRLPVPFRRWFAFTLDMTLYETLWHLFLLPVFRVNLLQRSAGGRLLDMLVQLALLFLLEPLFLSRLGTTPGKWVLGLSLRDSGGGMLRYRDALRRTFLRWRYGLGFSLPVWSLVRSWKSCMACLDGETLEWECDWRYDSVMKLRDERKWRYAAWIAAFALLIGATVFAVRLAERPVYRGELTVEQFCRNYNRYADYWLPDDAWRLDDDGQWRQKYTGSDIQPVIIVGPQSDAGRPALQFTVKDGVMTGLFFDHNQYNAGIPSVYTNEMQLLFLSFAGAQKGAGLWMGEVRRAARKIAQSGFQDFDVEANGVGVQATCDYEGYAHMENWGLVKTEGSKTYRCTITFSMHKS